MTRRFWEATPLFPLPYHFRTTFGRAGGEEGDQPYLFKKPTEEDASDWKIDAEETAADNPSPGRG